MSSSERGNYYRDYNITPSAIFPCKANEADHNLHITSPSALPICNSLFLCSFYFHSVTLVPAYVSLLPVCLLQEFWVTGGKRETTITIITVVESIAVAVGSEFKVYLKELVPMILKSMIHDSKEKQVTGKVRNH